MCTFRAELAPIPRRPAVPASWSAWILLPCFRRRLLALGSLLCVLWGCSSSPPIPGIPVTGPVSLLELLPQSRKSTAPGGDVESNVRVVELKVEGEVERALFLHPTSEVVFPLRLERAAVLDTAVAVDPAGWVQGGDGVTFYVAARKEGDDLPTYLFSRHLAPQVVEAHRGWQRVHLDLTAYQGQNLELILGTDPGPDSDPRYDWAAWREPLLYHPVLDAEWVSGRRRIDSGHPAAR